MSDVVLIERDGPLATVVLNKPEKLNALDKSMWRGVGDAFTLLNADEGVRCVVLRGAGDKALGPGADIKEFETERANAAQAAEYGALMRQAMSAIGDCRHPVVARIQGLCIGGALELAAMCDLRISGQSARFGIPVNKLGLVMSHHEMAGLIGLVGRSTALEILFEARVFGAAEAMAKGLLTRVVPDDQLDTELTAMTTRICAGAPLVNRWHKAFANRITQGLTEGRPLAPNEVSEGFDCFDTEDFQEGYRAFLEKRAPVFKGR
jgi:enoyl-CoA hydratase